MPQLSIVILTLNEQRNIAACLGSLARQSSHDFDVVLVDAASSDRTFEVARHIARHFPVPLRIEALSHRASIGEARNLGVQLATAPNVAFLSADAELDEGWVARATQALERADMAFSRQVHAPRRWTTGASVRGLRYHFPSTAVADANPYASNVAAAYRRAVVERFPFDPWANAAEDLLLAVRAQAAGFTATYEPGMVVHHHDVETVKQEWRKVTREGYGWAQYAGELGSQPGLLAWGTALLAVTAISVVRPRTAAILLAGALWAPALRRAWRHRKDLPVRAIAKGVAASPVFDVAFLVQHVRGLVARRRETPSPAPSDPPTTSAPSTPSATSLPSSRPPMTQET